MITNGLRGWMFWGPKSSACLWSGSFRSSAGCYQFFWSDGVWNQTKMNPRVKKERNPDHNCSCQVWKPFYRRYPVWDPNQPFALFYKPWHALVVVSFWQPHWHTCFRKSIIFLERTLNMDNFQKLVFKWAYINYF